MAVANVVAKFEADISDVQAKMATLKQTFQQASDSTKSLSDRMIAVGGGMATAGRKMTLGVSLPLAAIGAASVKTAMDFESSMMKIQSLVGIAADEVSSMEQEVLAMAGTVGKAPEELANGLFVLTSAGLRGAEAMSALEQAGKAGAAGLGETNDIARALAGAMQAYGSDVLSASDATDAIVATARAGNFEVSQFAGAIGRVLPFAQQAGASFQDMGGAVALLTRVNGDAAQSVTQMAALFRAFVVPSEQAKEALNEVGLSAEDMRNAIAEKGLPAALQMLDDKLGGNREQLGRLLGSSEAASAAFQILNADATQISETFGVVNDSVGMTEDAFNKTSQTAQFKMNQAITDLKVAMIDLGNEIMPVVTAFIDFARTVVQGFNNLPGPVKTFITVIGGIVTALGPILWIIGKIIVAIGMFGSAWAAAKAKAVAAFASISASVKTTEVAIKTAMISANTQMGAVAAGAKMLGIQIAAGLRTAAVAVRGFIAAWGPIGIAIVGVTLIMDGFMQKSAAVEASVASLREEVDLTAQKLTETGQRLVAEQLFSVIKPEDQAALAAFGISMDEILAAVLAGGPAFEALQEKLIAFRNQEFNPFGRMSGSDIIAQINTVQEGVMQTFAAAQAAADAGTAANVRNSDSARAMAESHRGAAQEARAAAEGIMSDGARMTEVTTATAEAVRALRDAFSELREVTSDIRASDAAKDALEELNASIKKNGDGFSRATDATRENRDALLNYVDAQIAFAESLEEPQAQLEALMELEAEVKAALKEGGVKPSESALYQSIRDAIDEAEAKVGEMDTAIADAESAGLEVAEAIAAGIEAGMSDQEAAINAAGLAGGEALIDGLNSGAGVSSPSTFAIAAGQGVGQGLVQGVNGYKGQASSAGNSIGSALIQGMIGALNAGQGSIAAAARAAVEAGIAAARAAGGISSPSKVFYEIGRDLVDGLVIGLRASRGKGEKEMSAMALAFTRAFAKNFFPRDMGDAESAIAAAIALAEEKLADARDNLKDANKDLRDAEKELNQARRESTNAAEEQERAERRLAQAQEKLNNAKDKDARKDAEQAVKQAEDELADARRNANRAARDLTTAEGALARARREATEAANAAKLAAWVEANRKALAELQKIAATFDRIKEKTAVAQQGFTALAQLVATPFGQPNDISKMFGSDAGIDSVINGFFKIRDSVKQAYAVLTDASIVGEKAAARNRKAMRQTIRELENLTAQAVQLREQHAAVMEQLETLEQDYQKDVAETNAFYDAAEKAAEENIKAIEDRWAAAIPVLQEALKSANDAYEKENATLKKLIDDRDQFVGSIKSGFRSFVNSLSFESRAATKQIVKETKRLADGVTVTLERELEVGGGPSAIRETLQERLDAVREFSRNIRTLMERGLDPTLVRDFVSAGVNGAGAAAAALAAGSQEDIAAINTVQSQLLSEAEDFGAYASAQWHDIGIAQQQAIVAPLEIARDAAQKALDDANALREQELATARAHLDKLKADRQAALAVLEAEYVAKKAELEAQAAALTAQMDAVAAQIEEKIAAMVNETALASAQAGRDAAQKLLDGFKKKYPGLYKEMNSLMTQLANSMNRTATVFVDTIFNTAVPVQTSAAQTANRGRSLPGATPNMGPRGVAQGGGNTYQITVNAGVGDPREIGRVTVDAITAYERSSGRVFARA